MWPVCWRQDDLHVHFKSTGAVRSTHKCSWVLLHADVNYFEISLARKSRMIIGIEFEISGLGSSPSCCWVFILSPNMRRNRYLPTGYFWLFFNSGYSRPPIKSSTRNDFPMKLTPLRLPQVLFSSPKSWVTQSGAPVCTAAWTKLILHSARTIWYSSDWIDLTKLVTGFPSNPCQPKDLFLFYSLAIVGCLHNISALLK